jgi:hypothetical protein
VDCSSARRNRDAVTCSTNSCRQSAQRNGYVAGDVYLGWPYGE